MKPFSVGLKGNLGPPFFTLEGEEERKGVEEKHRGACAYEKREEQAKRFECPELLIHMILQLLIPRCPSDTLGASPSRRGRLL